MGFRGAFVSLILHLDLMASGTLRSFSKLELLYGLWFMVSSILTTADKEDFLKQCWAQISVFFASVTHGHLVLHCNMALRLGRLVWCLWAGLDLSSVVGGLVCSEMEGFGNDKEGKTLWNCAISIILWCVWMERSSKIFDKKNLGFNLLLECVNL